MTCEDCRNEWEAGHSAGHYDGYGDALRYEGDLISGVFSVLDAQCVGDLTDAAAIESIKTILYYIPEGAPIALETGNELF